jgi:hypothetical protein
MNQIEIHNRIDKFVTAGVAEADAVIVQEFIVTNFDAREYYFSKLDVGWIEWLDTNGFFDVLNKASEDPTRYNYRMPELGYLESVVKDNPNKVTEIILKVDPVKNFNPEVVDRFVRISESLSGENLKKVVKKIHDDNWVELMQKFSNWSYAYERIIENLEKEGDVEMLVLLADTILTVRKSREEVRSNPFVLDSIGRIKLFNVLSSFEGQKAEKAFEFAVGKLKEVIESGGSQEDIQGNKVFKIEEPAYFSDLDLFTLEVGENRSISYRDDIENLMAVVVSLVRKVIGGKCSEESKVREMYVHIEALPDSWSTWRFKLFALSLCPEQFKGELEVKFDRLFEVMEAGKFYYEIESGAEYKKALATSFSFLSVDYQKEYVENIFKYFDPSLIEGEDEKKWRGRDALQILKVLNLSDSNLEERAKKVFGESYKSDSVSDPKPSVTSSGFARAVRDRSPISIAEQEVAKIPALLKAELSPEIMKEKYKGDSFLRPRNIEGVGNELREDVPKRISDYLENIDSFFAPSEISQHYTYCVLQGIENTLRDKSDFPKDKWEKLLVVLEKIETSDLPEVEKEEYSFLANWEAVRRVSANILKYSLEKEFLQNEMFEKNRGAILSVISSLLKSVDPLPEHEQGKHGDLFTVAINSVRGVAYQAFMQLIYLDGEELKDDTKKVFDELISENNSLAVWFVIGHYLPTLYFRDEEWVKARLPKIFDIKNDIQFFASWEGYLLASVYKEFFEEMKEYYLYALKKDEKDYPKRSDRAKDPDEAIGVHLSLAYTHFENVDLEHKLIKTLWKEGSAEKQGDFISHIGRSVISSSVNNIKDQPKTIQKILDLWDYVLDRKEVKESVFSEFGFWISRDTEILPLNEVIPRFAQTLERSGGLLQYDYNFKERLKDFAEFDPKKTLSMLENFLLKGTMNNRDIMWTRMDASRVDIFKTLYKANPEKTKKLIDDLWSHPNGGKNFWVLQEVLE